MEEGISQHHILNNYRTISNVKNNPHKPLVTVYTGAKVWCSCFNNCSLYAKHSGLVIKKKKTKPHKKLFQYYFIQSCKV